MSNHRNILIVGATSGIGSEIARVLNPSCHLFFTGRDENKLAALEKELLNAYPAFNCDLGNHEDIQQLSLQCPALDGMVFCAGVAPTLPVKYIRPEEIRQTMSVNFEGAVLTVAALMKQKKINQGASLVFISSEAVRHPFFGSSLYSASKAALEAFALSVANEFQSKKIRANCISPSYVESPMLDQARTTMSDDFIAGMKKMHPEAFCTAANIAAITSFLLSEDSSSVNGQVIKAGRFNINIPGL